MTKLLLISLPLHCKGLLPQDAYLNNPNSISIYRTSDLIAFVRPSNPDRREEEEPNDDCIVAGVVIVHLTQPRRVMALRARFVPLRRLAFPNRQVKDEILYESSGTSDVPRPIPISNVPYKLYFTRLPPHIAPFNRTPAGAIWHKVEATLVGSPAEGTEGDLSASSSNWLGGWMKKARRSSSLTGGRGKPKIETDIADGFVLWPRAVAYLAWYDLGDALAGYQGATCTA